MSIIKSYVINSIGSFGGPIFEPPRVTGIPYSDKEMPRAASVDDAKTVVDGVMSNISNLNMLITDLESKLQELILLWNKCIIIDDKPLEIVPEEDLNKEIKNLKDTCTNGKEECDSILNSYTQSIDEINQYLQMLANNYAEYKELLRQESIYANAVAIARNSSPQSNEYIENNKRLARTRQELSRYVNVKDVTDYGVWVKE